MPCWLGRVRVCCRCICAGRISRRAGLRLLAEPELPPLNTGYLAIRSDAGPRSPASRLRATLLEALG
ncbi:hypothetical protein [Kribbella catacumbae]|uniref:hypothetical protein n=1 Tax=Kribbella catacumbae TaxID=460086 RepID=UPI00192C48D6|nr:hypothetical protein [Kribbella catacumbae]